MSLQGSGRVRDHTCWCKSQPCAASAPLLSMKSTSHACDASTQLPDLPRGAGVLVLLPQVVLSPNMKDCAYRSCHLQSASKPPDVCAGGLTWQDFYSVHVHARPSYRFPATSFFQALAIEDRINVAWGSWDIVCPPAKQAQALLGGLWQLSVSKMCLSSDLDVRSPVQSVTGRQQQPVPWATRRQRHASARHWSMSL